MARTEPVGGGPKGKKGFPIGDKKHARLAIGGATRSFRAGNISESKEEEIKRKARAKLGHGSKQDNEKRASRAHRMYGKSAAK